MKLTKVLAVLMLCALVFPVGSFAQSSGTITGTVEDFNFNERLPYVNIVLLGTNRGTVTNANGEFTLKNVPAGTYSIRASFIGYAPITREIEVKAGETTTVEFFLEEAALAGHEVLVQASRARERETPVAFTEVNEEIIQERVASLDVPLVLNTTPSVYSTESGGGAGDARLNIRGFNQRNIAVMINGVPVNDMENGWVYWSNWAGLGDVTESIQVQRGLGASPYSVSSIGGVVNVQTYSSANATERRAMLRQQFGSDNTVKTSLMYSSGLLDNGVAFSMLLTRKTGDGYVDETWTDEFGYFFTIGKKFGKHNLDLTVVGAPQQHGQRTSKETITDFQTRGTDYNDAWGYQHGKVKHTRVNFYHKPVFNINHSWLINNKTLLSNVLYASWGTGGGTGPYGPTFFSYDDAGQIDFDAAYAKNDTSTVGSYSIIRASRNNHSWYGFLSTLKREVNKQIDLSAGIDFRYYVGEHYRTIEDLIGGDYFVDSWSRSTYLGNPRNKNRDPEAQLKIGDKINYHNDGIVMLGGGFLQTEYVNDQLSAFLNFSVNSTRYKRVDYFLDRNGDGDDDPNTGWEQNIGLDPVETDWVSFTPYTIKTGANYNLNDAMNVFFNVGYLTAPPAFENTFYFDNSKIDGVELEKITGMEIGYGYRTFTTALLVNLYRTQWKDKALVIRADDGARYNVNGLEALHQGIEIEARHYLTPEFELEGMLSIGDHKWNNDVGAIVRDDTGQEIGALYLATEDLHVGDFPMTTASFGFRYDVQVNNYTRAYVNPVLKYFGRQYAEFQPESRDYDPNDPDSTPDRADSWQMPDYSLVDIYAGYTFTFKNAMVEKLTLGLNLYNALNTEYIADAEDRGSHDEHSARVYYGRGRTFNVSLSATF
ncbi:MAG: TonB-dependent receptor [Gemmatimonadetes bacterium]|nr:MAG: TonB-dependent receptor [Gemmatimonadota bacterium]